MKEWEIGVLSVTICCSKFGWASIGKACNFSAATTLSEIFMAAMGFKMLFGVQVFIVWNHTFPSTRTGISNQQIHANENGKKFCVMKRARQLCKIARFGTMRTRPMCAKQIEHSQQHKISQHTFCTRERKKGQWRGANLVDICHCSVEIVCYA